MTCARPGCARAFSVGNPGADRYYPAVPRLPTSAALQTHPGPQVERAAPQATALDLDPHTPPVAPPVRAPEPASTERAKARAGQLGLDTPDRRGAQHRSSGALALRRSSLAGLGGPELSSAGARVTTTDLAGRPAEFTVNIGPELAATMKRSLARLDVQTGELVLKDGTRLEVTGARTAFRDTFGRDAPPWTYHDRVTKTWGPPRGTVTLELSGEHLVLRCPEGQQLAVDVLRRPTVTSAPARLSPLPADLCDTWKVEVLAEGVTLTGPSPALLAAARTVVDEVLGKTLGKHPETRRGCEQALRELTALKREGVSWIAEEPPSAAGLAWAARAWSKIGQIADPARTPVEAYNALHAVAAKLSARLQPVELIVVPKGSSYLDMPQLAPYREELIALLPAVGEAARVQLASKALVFLPEEDLEGRGLTSKHELYHQLEAWWPEATRQRIDALRDACVEAGGPFARPYGVQRTEFVTTLAEEFELKDGELGGPSWVQHHHPELYEILASATGRRPTG